MDNVVYVGNLPLDVSPSELRDRFSEHGEVRGVEIVVDRQTRHARPIGVVTMKDRTDAGRAIRALNGSFLADRALVVGWMGGRVLPGKHAPHGGSTARTETVPPPAPSPRAPARPAPPIAEERRDEYGSEDGSRRRKGGAPTAKPPVRMLQQFRERTNMTYELECSGTPLVLRMFFPNADSSSEWRVEASTTQGPRTATAAASSRALALASVARQWRENDVASSPAGVDWDAVTEVMATVRAI